MLILPLVQRALRVEVVDTAITILLTDTLAFRLLLVIVVASHVCEQIHWPASKLLPDHVGCGVDWSLFEKLVHLMQNKAEPSGLVLTSARREDHISLHMAGGFVVLAMADLPAEVWDEQSRVDNPTDGVVESLAWREGLMTTFMG